MKSPSLRKPSTIPTNMGSKANLDNIDAQIATMEKGGAKINQNRINDLLKTKVKLLEAQLKKKRRATLSIIDKAIAPSVSHVDSELPLLESATLAHGVSNASSSLHASSAPASYDEDGTVMEVVETSANVDTKNARSRSVHTDSESDEDYSDDDNKNDNFIQVKSRHHKRSKTELISQPIQTENKFEPLTIADNISSEIVNQQKEITPPPIFIKEVECWRNIAHAITRAKINIKSSRISGEAIKLQPNTSTDYRNLRKLLDDSQVQFYTFMLKTEKPIQVVIHGLHKSIENTEVFEDLKARHFPVTKVYRIGKTQSLIAVHLERCAKAKEIFSLTDMLYLKVKIESKKKVKTPGQCFRCQRFGHSSAGCNLHWRCVRCGENHATAACEKKDKNTNQAKCANCKLEHTANYKGCPTYKQAIAKKPTVAPKSAPVAKTTAAKSYAAAVAANSQASTSELSRPAQATAPSTTAIASIAADVVPPNSSTTSPAFDLKSLVDLLANFSLENVCKAIADWLESYLTPSPTTQLIKMAVQALPSLIKSANNGSK